MDKTTLEIIQLYLKQVEEKYNVTIQVLPKSQSKLLKLLRPLIETFNKNYWNNYITTLGNTIWVPDNWLEPTSNDDVNVLLSKVEVIAHESIHIKQAKEQTIFIHNILYLFPQILVIFSLLAFLAIPFNIAWLWTLLFLLFLLPIPAPFRYLKELEGYRTKILFYKIVYKVDNDGLQFAKNIIIQQLSGSSYYFAWPFKKLIQNDLNNEQALQADEYKQILSFLKSNNLLSQ